MRTPIITLMLMVSMGWASAQERVAFNMPIIQTKYTADHAPYVHGDTVYLYTSHERQSPRNHRV